MPHAAEFVATSSLEVGCCTCRSSSEIVHCQLGTTIGECQSASARLKDRRPGKKEPQEHRLQHPEGRTETNAGAMHTLWEGALCFLQTCALLLFCEDLPPKARKLTEDITDSLHAAVTADTCNTRRRQRPHWRLQPTDRCHRLGRQPNSPQLFPWTVCWSRRCPHVRRMS